ncbi:hypothetical protein [Curtobacterium sp. MCBD17_008]|uniref:hypothetical protein n=1 Tax=Curtobacterium sp. MCBD17_008 TaxID=2175656 RepID=UPI002691D7F2|nr:hypothetical protein [Curtobacterium sp. MCBD17_008]
MPGVGDDGDPTDDLVGRGGLPEGSVEVPAAVVGVARGRPLEPVWVNSAGGRTFRLGPTPDRAEGYVKWVPPRYAPWIDAEVARLRWAARWLTVPEVLEHGPTVPVRGWRHDRCRAGVPWTRGGGTTRARR